MERMEMTDAQSNAFLGCIFKRLVALVHSHTYARYYLFFMVYKQMLASKM